MTLIDIREDDERVQSGAIPNAVRAPRGMFEFWADPTSAYQREEFDPARRTILYCASGGRLALAANTLQRMGYENATHLSYMPNFHTTRAYSRERLVKGVLGSPPERRRMERLPLQRVTPEASLCRDGESEVR